MTYEEAKMQIQAIPGKIWDLLSEPDREAMEMAFSALQAQPELNFDEWCTDCKEYDHEKHCCPRWNRVIRQALSEQPEIIRCKDCKYRGGFSGFYCDIVEKAVGTDSFCSWAERRG